MKDENKTRLLNESGFPFQDFCFGAIDSKEYYKATQEVPFTHPPSEGVQLGKSGTIDILAVKLAPPLATYSSPDLHIFLIIECKRANPDIKNWVFINNIERYKYPTFFISQIRNGQYLPDVTRRGSLSQLDYGSPESFEGCRSVIELNEALNSRSRNKEDNVYKAALQANQGLNAFFSRLPKNVEGLESLPPIKKAVYLPVVVTTANLYLANYNPYLVSPAGGEIAWSDVSYSDKKWITYEFPLPDYLKATGSTRTPYFKNIERATTIIVNSTYWNEFLSKLCFRSPELDER